MHEKNLHGPVFRRADILLPRRDLLQNWSVVACDQHTSDRGYWDRLSEKIGDSPSALRLILPEAYLGDPEETGERSRAVIGMMRKYLEDGVFSEYKSSMVYLRRSLPGGGMRRGLVGAADLAQYEYLPGSQSPIRASEETVLQRIPPRMEIRLAAPLELPHVLLLADDPGNKVFGLLDEHLDAMAPLYDFELNENGGHIEGFLVPDELLPRLEQMIDSLGSDGIKLAVGDGNHSLAAARAGFDEVRREIGVERSMTHPARFALAELINIHDGAAGFLPIHRVVFGANPDAVLAALSRRGGEDFRIKYFAKGRSGEISMSKNGHILEVGAVQEALDGFAAISGARLDYIHGDAEAMALAKTEQCTVLLMPEPDKSRFFETVAKNGTMPRKSFSIGRANEKRYYLEARRIR